MILYKKDETNFAHLGLGPLKDAHGAEVTEELNAGFYLEITYPLDGDRFDEIEPGSIIKCDAGHKSKDQLFVVERIDSTLTSAKIHATHVSRLAEKNQLSKDVVGRGTAQQAIQAWIGALVDKSRPWTAWSDKNFSAPYSWLVEETDNALRALGGQQGSALQVFRGEYEWDNWDIKLWTNRGKRADTIIAYGRNLVDIKQEEIILDTYTSVMPFVYREEDDENPEIKLTLPESVVHSEHVEAYGAPRILKLDLSDDEEITTIAQLRTEALDYIERNQLGVPSVSITVKHQDLSQVLGYEDAPQEVIGLADVVPIRFEKLGISTEAKVVKAKWDVLLEEYTELSLGDTSRTLAQAIRIDIDAQADKLRDEAVRYARIAASGKSKIYQGELEPPNPQSGDVWFRPVGSDTDMYRYEDGAWIRVLGTADFEDAGRLITGTLDAAQVNVINLDANNITAGKVKSSFLEVGADTIYYRDENDSTTLGARLNVMENEIRTDIRSEASHLEESLDGLYTEVSEISSTVSQQLDSWEVRFREQDLNPLYNEMDSQGERISTIEGSVRITSEGIEISRSLSDFVLALQADKLAFRQAGKDIAWMTDSQLVITEGKFLTSMDIGSFRFLPRDNGNLSIV